MSTGYVKYTYQHLNTKRKKIEKIKELQPSTMVSDPKTLPWGFSWIKSFMIASIWLWNKIFSQKGDTVFHNSTGSLVISNSSYNMENSTNEEDYNFIAKKEE